MKKNEFLDIIYNKKEVKIMVSEKLKLRVIWKIDQIQTKWPEWRTRDLNTLRSKYIYKDISLDDLKKDIVWLRRAENDEMWSYYTNSQQA